MHITNQNDYVLYIKNMFRYQFKAAFHGVLESCWKVKCLIEKCCTVVIVLLVAVVGCFFFFSLWICTYYSNDFHCSLFLVAWLVIQHAGDIHTTFNLLCRVKHSIRHGTNKINEKYGVTIAMQIATKREKGQNDNDRDYIRL